MVLNTASQMVAKIAPAAASDQSRHGTAGHPRDSYHEGQL